MRFDEILVKELHDEHRDREWVDAYGIHWAWCGDVWMWRWPKPNHMGDHQWVAILQDGAQNSPRPDCGGPGPAPFMEALHHRVIHERR